MLPFRSSPRSRRQRNAQPAPEQQQQPFFQPKLTIGQPDDAYEREADAVADTVVQHGSRPAANQGQATVQRKPISRVQRLATPEEDKMPATNDGRMAEDKKIQEKPIQKADAPGGKEEEKPVQKADAPGGKEEEKPVQKADAPGAKEEEKPVQKADAPGAKEEEKPVQKADAPGGKEEEKPVQKADAPGGKEEEKPVQKADAPGGKEEEKPVQKADAPGGKEEEKPVQKADAPGGKEEEKPVQKADAPGGKEEEKPVQKADAPGGKEEEKPVQAKSAGTRAQTSPDFSARLSARRGQGEPLPRSVRAEMERGIGADFSQVRLHRDTEAAQMSKEIHAQAFTQGRDVYFSSGKYDPGSMEGKHLLAHELTHVVQQGHAAPDLQKKDPVASTPVPKGYKAEKDDAGNIEQYSGTEAGVEVVILPDQRGAVPEGSSGATKSDFDWDTPGWESDENGKITKVDGKASVKLTIQTTYKPDADPAKDSAYGRGTTSDDQKTGKKSLRHHEGSHGTESILYLRQHPIPKFKGKKGMTEEQYQKAIDAFDLAMQKYQQAFNDFTRDQVDCVGKPADFCAKN